jgi:hypothetical protein
MENKEVKYCGFHFDINIDFMLEDLGDRYFYAELTDIGSVTTLWSWDETEAYNFVWVHLDEAVKLNPKLKHKLQYRTDESAIAGVNLSYWNLMEHREKQSLLLHLLSMVLPSDDRFWDYLSEKLKDDYSERVEYWEEKLEH